jgi:hypothetical protein
LWARSATRGRPSWSKACDDSVPSAHGPQYESGQIHRALKRWTFTELDLSLRGCTSSANDDKRRSNVDGSSHPTEWVKHSLPDEDRKIDAGQRTIGFVSLRECRIRTDTISRNDRRAVGMVLCGDFLLKFPLISAIFAIKAPTQTHGTRFLGKRSCFKSYEKESHCE